MAEAGKLDEVVATLAPRFVHPNRRNDAALMATSCARWPRCRPAGLCAPAEGDHVAPGFAAAAGRRSAARRWCWSATAMQRRRRARAEMAAGIPGARLVMVPDCGHLSTLERPEAVNAALTQWLAA